ncbi:alpha/beta hydrolase [Nonomuraea recticatena]|uniref:BD-FAE-like domain-containing protein n=1 Tax=Nonomuraea recticatena TaxID=46178 RepID=A0ABN3RFZ6_9ACTN
MRAAVIAGVLAAVSLVPGTALASKDPAPSYGDALGNTAMETISYGPSRSQAMDVWWTPDYSKHPAVFLIHGGWWSSGDKKYMTEVTRSYVELGYTVFNLNYRLSGEAAWPAQRTDTFDAIATARRHADRWNFDPTNYVIVGFSAGGHIAAAVGTYGDGTLPGLKGVVGVSPVISPLRAYTDGAASTDPNRVKLRDAAIKLAGGCEPKGKCSRVWASMEVPWHASKRDAPMLTVHSDDEFVPVTQSLLLKDMLGQVGVKMTVFTEPGISHSAPLYRQLGVADRVQSWIQEQLS